MSPGLRNQIPGKAPGVIMRQEPHGVQKGASLLEEGSSVTSFGPTEMQSNHKNVMRYEILYL